MYYMEENTGNLTKACVTWLLLSCDELTAQLMYPGIDHAPPVKTEILAQ